MFAVRLKRFGFFLQFVFGVVGFTLLAFPILAHAATRPTVTILSSGSQRLTLQFTFENWTVEDVTIRGERFVRLDFANALFSSAPGQPQVPHQTAVIGIPPGARVRSRILDSEFETLDQVQVLPQPYLKRVEGASELAYEADARFYRGEQPSPQNLVEVTEPEWFREQQIVRVKVAGAQFFPAQRRLRQYRRVVVELEFLGGQPANPAEPRAAAPDRVEEALYRAAMLNYGEARLWRRPSRPDRLRKAPTRNRTLYRFRIQEEGIYKIDGAFLEANISNLNLAALDPSKIRLFNNGGRELPRDLDAPRPEGLVENAIVVVDGGDGRFDRNDFILFYGRGVEGWDYDPSTQRFRHYINHYGFDNVYWLDLEGSEDGKRVQPVRSAAPAEPATTVYQGLAFVEEELDIPVRSGLNWFGRTFAMDEISRSHSFTLDLPNVVSDQPARFDFRFASKTSGRHTFSIAVNDRVIGTHGFFGASPFFGQYLRMQISDFSAVASEALVPGRNTLTLTYSHTASTGQALLDWFEIAYPARLQAIDNELAFTVMPDSGLQTYRVSGFSGGNVQLFDVTDFANVRQIVDFQFSAGAVTFADVQSPGQPKRYLALTPEKYKAVNSLERVEYVDLRGVAQGANFVIITYDDFHSEALRLESLRENGNPDNHLQTEVVRISDVYNSFSGGLVDPVAIRDFLRYAYENWSPRPAYVLLLGDGDFDYKNLLSAGDPNWIPPFQTDEIPTNRMVQELVSRTTDSWFTYVSGNDRTMDLAIGRITAQTLDEARRAIDKIISYEMEPLRGNWRNTVTMVGDDELVGGGRPSAADDIHIRQAEFIAQNSFPQCFDVQKIYLTEYPKVVSASVSGVVKPQAREALLRQINKGTLIVNYIGHGNSRLWAHERVFRIEDNDRVQNGNKLIFFVAATCDWAYFDFPDFQSQAEELLVAEGRGAIAILSSARLVFAGQNFTYNRTYYSKLFSGQNGRTLRLGDAFVASRIQTDPNNLVNNEKYHIYGDPTLRLAMPREEAVITSMTPDSIVALTTVEIQGEIQIDGVLQSDFNGKAQLNVFDSQKFVQHQPEAGSVQKYFLPGNSIYRGQVPVQNGVFQARFIVPKDISYGGNLARVLAYVWNDETDAAGCRDNIKVSSTSGNLVDRDGPEMRLYFKGYEDFVTGDVIPENVTMVVEIADTVSGVNIAGEIGHRLTLTIDPDEETCITELNRSLGITEIDLTDLFQFNEGDHLRGTVEFPLSFPDEIEVAGRKISCLDADGENRHTLVVKAWDNANNSSTVSAEVRVVSQAGLVLDEVMNYPNPFSQNTTFTFVANQDAEVIIKIYTIAGQLIRTLEYPFATSGFNMVEWDGRDADGNFPANGVYLYKIIAKAIGDADKKQVETPVQTLAIIR